MDVDGRVTTARRAWTRLSAEWGWNRVESVSNPQDAERSRRRASADLRPCAGLGAASGPWPSTLSARPGGA